MEPMFYVKFSRKFSICPRGFYSFPTFTRYRNTVHFYTVHSSIFTIYPSVSRTCISCSKTGRKI